MLHYVSLCQLVGGPEASLPLLGLCGLCLRDQTLPSTGSNQVTVTCDGGSASMFQGFLKGLYYGSGPRGQFIGDDARYPGGANGAWVSPLGSVPYPPTHLLASRPSPTSAITHDLGMCSWAGIRVGDGYHNYLVVGMVSCNHSNAVPPNRQIIGAELQLTASRVYGE